MDWLQSLGYLGAFLGAVMEGEIVLITFIQLARLGYLNLYLVIGAFSLGTLVTDWTCFFIGRTKGRQFFVSRPKWKSQFDKMDRLMSKREQTLLLTYRFMYGFRFVLPMLFGLSSVSIRRFLVYSLLGNFVWVGLFATLGYFFAELVIQHLEWIQANLLYILLVLGAIIFSVWYILRIRRATSGRK